MGGRRVCRGVGRRAHRPRGKLVFGLAIGTLGLLAAAANMLMFPHPIWVWVLGVAEFLPAAYLGAKLAMPRPSQAPASG